MGDGAVSVERRRTTAQVSLAVGLVAAVFVLVMCALLTATHLQLKNADPLNNATLVGLRDRYADGERGDQVKADIRQLDLLARKAFFTGQAQIRAGGVAAVIAGALMLVAFGIYQAAMRNVPPVNRESREGMFWIGVQRSRAWVAGGTVALVAVSVVMVVSTPTELTVDLVRKSRLDGVSPSMASGAVVVDPLEGETLSSRSAVSVFPAGFADNAPVFRGAGGTGLTDFDDVPTEWDESKGKNLLWKKPLVLPAWASPVVWGDKVVALGADAGRRMVYCLDAGTGEEVWTTEVPPHDDATEDYETNTTDDRWDSLVYAGATPAVNGKQVFAQFSNGQLVALDLVTGKVLWNIVPAETDANTYGVDNSLLIYRDSVIGAFEGNESFIARYDAETGKSLWKTERASKSLASPLLATLPDGSHLVVLPADPDVTAWDPETGRQVWSTNVLVGEIEYCVGPSPVQAGDKVCVNMQYCGMYGLNLADGSVAWKLEELPDGSGFADGASMTSDGRYVYQFHASTLTRVDAGDGKVVKQMDLDEYASYSSALLNKGRLYVSGSGTVLVLDADPETGFAEVGKGSIDDSSDATPAIVKGRVYIRSDESLYCFGKP